MHLDNLGRIAIDGVRCDSDALGGGLCVTEVGEPAIKLRRRQPP
jgi:hypothetical protein